MLQSKMFVTEPVNITQLFTFKKSTQFFKFPNQMFWLKVHNTKMN